MEIRDPIHGSIEVTPQETAVIDSQAFQRLRSIKQLGFGEFSFPGAVHNRYIHSLGACHLAGRAFDSIFQGYHFSKKEVQWRLRQVTRLAALLHDIGHGPLSHTTEEVMPPLKTLKVAAYNPQRRDSPNKASHEDYTIKIITDSELTEILKTQFTDLSPIHIACLIDRTLDCPDDFFVDNGVNIRPILSQLVSSELDVDRMDYLLRDSHFCGTNYGQIEIWWLIANLTHHLADGKLHLALNRRALYTFDDFLISRHHMYLMVYFHHKAIIFDEMLHRYLTSKECTYHLPSEIDQYLNYTDSHLYEHLRSTSNPWAKRIATRTPFRVLFEVHETEETSRPLKIAEALNKKGIETIHSSSIARLSKYHASLSSNSSHRMFVVDAFNRWEDPYPLEQSTEIFQKYEKHRRIERLYVSPEDYLKAQDVLNSIQF